MRQRRHQTPSHQSSVKLQFNLRVRSIGNSLVPVFAYVQDTTDWRKWRFRSVSLRNVAQLETEGKVKPETRLVDGEVQIVGWRSTEPLRAERPSPTTLTMATSRAVSGEYHGGRCGERPTRREVEHVAKYLLWPQVGDQRAVAVRPRQSEQHRRLAMDLVGANGAAAADAAERMIERGALARAA